MPEDPWRDSWRRSDVVSDLARLSRRHVLALSVVAALSVGGQLLVQGALLRHAKDSSVINTAGRQRMLSQRLAKAALALARTNSHANLTTFRREIASVLDEWTRVHRALQHGDAALGIPPPDSAVIASMYAGIEPCFAAMARATERLLGFDRETGASAEANAGADGYERELQRLLALEPAFLARMDAIVERFQLEADRRVADVQRIELALLGLILLTLVLEGRFVLRPATVRIRRTWARLEEASRRLRHSEADKSAMLRAIPDMMFRIDLRGTVRSPHSPRSMTSSLAEIFPDHAHHYLEHAARAIALDTVTSFEYPVDTGDRQRHVEARLAACGPDEALVLVRDLTEQRRLQREILEISERERQRIGQDIHDDLCQQLAGIRLAAQSLKLRAERGEAIDAAEVGTVAELSDGALATASGLARGLYMTALGDSGLSSALIELATLTGARHTVRCTHELLVDDAQLPREVGLQMYRIAQEALNNVVKHASAARAHIALRREGPDVVLSVTDDGVGIVERPARRSGMGMHIMKNRARMIGSNLSVERLPSGGGTRVTCRIPAAT
jgi:signal transduction histidine kinase